MISKEKGNVFMKRKGMTFDREARRFVIIFAGITFLFGRESVHLGWIGVILTVWCLYFFRDPERILPLDDGKILVSPADGRIMEIGFYAPPEELDLGTALLQRVSIFMSVFSVHVNRAPMAGAIEKIVYIPGKFFNATLNKASTHNEREVVSIHTAYGPFVYVRIAGLIARRIRRDIREGDIVALGQRVGLIRFGSRVDVYLPTQAVLAVEEGQTMIAGETIIARFTRETHVV
jgi:phosphatidylserine decarboxylase